LIGISVLTTTLFFDAPVFELFAGDAFLLQVNRVFTRIHSGAVEGADCGSRRK
jgi:hypothetical protein